MNVLFACLGNICRSPIAAEMLRKKYQENNISGEIDSAGFEAFYINANPDEAAISAGKKHGIDITEHKARLFTSEDFNNFDVIYVMDSKNMRDIKYFAKKEEDLNKLEFIMNLVDPGKNKALPDPFFRELGKEEEVFDLMEEACNKIVEIAKNKK
jgi:protein-tyrosine phosphatase